MVGKQTAGIIILCATLLSLPAYAATLTEPPGQPAPGTAAADTQTPLRQQEAQQAKEAPKEGPGTDADNIDLNYIKGYAIDSGSILAAPLHWETKDWLKVGLVLGGTASLFLVDRNIKNFAQSHQSPVASKFATVGNDLGNPLYTLPPLGAFYLYGYLADDHKARRTSLLALESFAISGVMTEGIKSLASRHRPNTGDSPTAWDGPSFSMKNLSFSSGHTASAFSIATVFAEEYKDNPFVPPIAYTLATLTGLSRIYSNAHWASDTFFGAALGYFVSKGVLALHKEDKSSWTKRLMVMPQVGTEMTGLAVQYEF